MAYSHAMPVTAEVMQTKRIADKFQAHALPSTIIRYHTCGDIINSDEVSLHREYAQRTGYKFTVTARLVQHPDMRGVSDGSIELEKYFQSLACARLFMNWLNMRVATIRRYQFAELAQGGGQWYHGAMSSRKIGRGHLVDAVGGYCSAELREALK